MYIDAEEFIRDIKLLVQKELQASNKPQEYLTRQETADMLKINLSTLHIWTKKGILKAYGVESRVYYKRNEVESVLIPLEV